PDRGLITSVIAGFFISAVGGSRYQIGGPAAAFIVIIANLVDRHGLAALMTATFLAGFILIGAALLRLGTYIKYVPGPVILGFTSGIGIIIAIGQIKDFLGLTGTVPAEVLHKVAALWEMRGTFNPAALAVGIGTLAIISIVRAWRPNWPGLLVAVGAASGAAWLLGLNVETIGSRFGGIPNALPAPVLPDLSWTTVSTILPSAFTIAFLIGIESLLSAVAADAKTGGRHRSNVEVLAQGIANVASPLFGGLPATGVIARTGTNITAGAKTPVSGIMHSAFVLLFMLLLAPLASYLALPCLAAVLISVSWKLIDYHEVTNFITRAPTDDRLILIVTLVLTVIVDLNVAIAVGVVLACMLFMHRMAEVSGGGFGPGLDDSGDLDDVRQPRSAIASMELPEGISVFHMRGPLFFGGASTIADSVQSLGRWPKVLILRMRDVPLVDATALSTIEELASNCTRRGCRIIISGLQRQPRLAMHRMGTLRRHKVLLASNSFIALEKAKGILEESRRPAGAR
ncbi:MAG TPA: SulP family inorganic anion transporter, partial [Hyphomicrobiaceae bacterium]|nr:SulP family inorganic anion transporter [Hyphomicrobiaceae bacterium]